MIKKHIASIDYTVTISNNNQINFGTLCFILGISHSIKKAMNHS